ncbi:MAG: hypothetical protein HLUCCA04_04870 [Oceanicaulis sp. HLUCCA04]|nr:MAG: hypothetical protein HLUCCA04_04870 [Oceanicaulis sp. HLUCCA04]
MEGSETPLRIHLGFEGELLDELAARLHHIAHQLGEEIISRVGFLHRDPEKRARIRIERGFPELAGIHLSKTFIALDFHPLGTGLDDSVHQLPRTVNDGFIAFADKQERSGIILGDSRRAL